MVCEICHKSKIEAEVPEKYSEIFRVKNSFKLYACKCPDRFFDEINFIRENNINLLDLNQIQAELFTFNLQKKKEYIEIKSRTLNISEFEIMRMWNESKLENIKKTQAAIWYVLYDIKKNIKQEQENGRAF